jgi:hypothetical protein
MQKGCNVIALSTMAPPHPFFFFWLHGILEICAHDSGTKQLVVFIVSSKVCLAVQTYFKTKSSSAYVLF